MTDPKPFDAAEIARQHDLVWRESFLRLPLNVLAFSLTLIYLPLAIVLPAAAINIASELLNMRWMKQIRDKSQVWLYRGVLATTFMMEVSYGTCAALIWQLDVNHAKPFAVGMVMIALLHLATERAIHMPFGLAGYAGLALPIVVGNMMLWIPEAEWGGLVLSTICAAGVLSYTLTAMYSTNRLHHETAQGRIAAQAGNAAKTRFLAHMSHELRTPLNAILGMGHAELRTRTDLESKERLSVMISSAEGLGAILDDILDLSAIQAGAMPIRPRRAVPADEIRAICKLFEPAAERHGLKLLTEVAEDIADEFHFDNQRLRQCLTNLISNAVKHTRQGSVRVSACKTEGEHGQPILWIEVADTGPGVRPERHGQIFEPFNSHDENQPFSGATPARSNGLGLSISRALARSMGGDLQLTVGSKPGARFVLTIALSPVPPEETRLALPAIFPERLAGCRVLVVDDIATNRLVARSYLATYAMVVTEATSGAEALMRLAEQSFDVMLLDINMPDMDGLETLHRMRASGHDLPVLAMTADASSQQCARFLSQGMNGCLTKPLSATSLETTLCKVLGFTANAATDVNAFSAKDTISDDICPTP